MSKLEWGKADFLTAREGRVPIVTLPISSGDITVFVKKDTLDGDPHFELRDKDHFNKKITDKDLQEYCAEKKVPAFPLEEALAAVRQRYKEILKEIEPFL